MGDVLAMVPIMGLVLAAGFASLFVLAWLEGLTIDEFRNLDADDLPPSMIVVPTIIQQLAWFGWPFVVSRWKGLGAARDWGFRLEPIDLGIGLGVAFIAMTSAGLVATGTSALVGLDDETQADNTAILNDLASSAWIYPLIMVVVVGAPLAEELLFRGLLLRAVEKRLGTVVAVIASVVIFTVIHPADGGYFSAGQIVLWSAIGTLALVFTLTTVMTGRLAGAIIAHCLVNAVATMGALGHFDRLADLSFIWV
jgi:membrane protease YdiL (CAAX protease family)